MTKAFPCRVFAAIVRRARNGPNSETNVAPQDRGFRHLRSNPGRHSQRRSRKNLEPTRPRAGVSLIATLKELVMISLIVGGLLVLLPMLIRMGSQRNPSGNSGFARQIRRLSTVSNGTELWIHRGMSEITIVDITRLKAAVANQLDGCAIRGTCVSQDGMTYLLKLDSGVIQIYRNNKLLVSDCSDNEEDITVALSADGKVVVFHFENVIRRWDLSSDPPTASEFQLIEHVDSIVLDTTGLRLAVCSFEGFVRVYDATTGDLAHDLHGAGRTGHDMTFSNDGNWLALIRGDSLELYDVGLGKLVWNQKRAKDLNDLLSIAISPDGNLVAVSAVLSGLKIYGRVDGKLLQTMISKCGLNRIAFSRNGDEIFSGNSDGTISIWSVTSGLEVKRFNPFDDSSK